MSPKITIILPVYNVAPYLRQCLDSVVNQTMRDIQIICVNDGSTDGSRDILQEYADRDCRVEIIDQENQGGGSARNTAFPYIKGKYTYFADPDDWLDLRLCEKTYAHGEETEADTVFFLAQNFPEEKTVFFDPKLSRIRYLPEEKTDLLMRHLAPWRKIWKSSFLIASQVFFCEGKRPNNDGVQSWRGVVQAKKIAILNEVLYTRRIRPGSYQQTRDRSHFIIIKTVKDVEIFLKSVDLFAAYEPIFRRFKLHAFHTKYEISPENLRQEFSSLIRENLTTEDREFLRSEAGKALPKKIKRFYKMIDSGSWAKIHYRSRGKISNVIKWTERLIRRTIVKPLRVLIAKWFDPGPKPTDADILPFPSSVPNEAAQRRVA